MIDRFLQDLQDVPPTETFKNPYQNPVCRQNLSAYLEALMRWPYSGHLLVGEALGYRGGALTGIPFSSPRLLQTHPHPFLKALRPCLIIGDEIAEATATIVWDQLHTRRTVPAFWNVFPFHPHNPGEVTSNRKPKAREQETGRKLLDKVIEILAPEVLIGVGRVAEAALQKWNPEHRTLSVRHPSHGGKKAFAAGLTRAGIY
jgi:hypothetical protein